MGRAVPACQGVLLKDMRHTDEGPLKLRCQRAVLLCLEEVVNKPVLPLICAVSEPLCLQQNGESESTPQK